MARRVSRGDIWDTVLPLRAMASRLINDDDLGAGHHRLHRVVHGSFDAAGKLSGSFTSQRDERGKYSHPGGLHVQPLLREW